MAARQAWVFTWAGHMNGKIPSMPQGAALAALPVVTSKSKIEAALTVLHQLIEGSLPSSINMHVHRKSANEVYWDESGNFASIGHDPQVFARKATDFQLLDDSVSLDDSNGEGKLSWKNKDLYTSDVAEDTNSG